MSEASQEALVEQLQARRQKSMEEGQIDNTALVAGSSMYYYCHYCGVHTDTLPEDWWRGLPKEVCTDCETLIGKGWHDLQMPKFPLRGSSTGRVPSLTG